MRSFKEYSEKDITVVDYTPGMGKEISYNAQKRKRKDIEEISSNKLSDYMRKSAADAGKPGATARQQDKRIGGQSMADKKIRKKMGQSSSAKVPAGTNEDDASARMYKDNPDMMKQQGPGGFKSLDPKMKKTIKKTMKKLPPKPTNESAPKVDPDKFAAHMAKSKKPEKKTSTQNSLSDISKRANEEVQEGPARDRLAKMVDKASGRTMADRQKDAAAATARRKEADKDLTKFRSSMKTEEEDGIAQSYLDQDSEKKRKVKKDKDTAVANPKIDNKKDAVAEEQDQTDEALTMQQRRAKSRQMKRLKGRIKLGRERQKRKMADPERLKKRARKAARNEILKKLTKGVPKGELTYSRRQELEKRLDKPAIKGRIDRLAKKMLPVTRRKELDRRRGGASNKK